jgi:hypothetical protein
MNYTPETGFLYSSRIITDSVARNPVSRDLHLHGKQQNTQKPDFFIEEVGL